MTDNEKLLAFVVGAGLAAALFGVALKLKPETRRVLAQGLARRIPSPPAEILVVRGHHEFVAAAPRLDDSTHDPAI